MANDPKSRDKQHLRWLHDELPELLTRNVVDAATAERLRVHYNLGSLSEPRSVALLVFGSLGALLVGGGMILIVAHNWEELSRGGRAVISIALLAAAQLLCGYVLLRKRGSAAWSEASALALCLSLGASIALISQTYNLGGELGA